MTIKEFIRDIYPIKDKIAVITQDPVKQILEQDDLPCDAIMSVDGVLQKVVYITDDEYVPVVELLSYYEDEVCKMENKEFQMVYFAYMDNVDITNITIDNIMSASREYNEKKKTKEELLKCIQ